MRKKPTKEHWTDRHGFVLSAASAGLLAWALMSIWQDCEDRHECVHGECVPERRGR